MPTTYANGHISATGDPIHFMFGSRAGFSGTADRTALFTVPTNPRWRPPPCWNNFKWRYLRNRSSDPLHVLFYGEVFGDGGSNGAISGSYKSKMAAAAILEKFQIAISPQPVVYLRNGSRSTYISAHRAVIFVIAQLSCLLGHWCNQGEHVLCLLFNSKHSPYKKTAIIEYKL